MKLLILAACEKVLSDPQSGPSLIAIFNGMKVTTHTDAVVPRDALLPREWSIFSRWQLEPEEEGKNYTSSTEILWPDGTQFGRLDLVAEQPTADGMSFTGRLTGFPIGQNGKVRIIQTLKRDDGSVSGPFEMFLTVTVTNAGASSSTESASASTT
jgi:hypothetical protein